MGRDITAKGKTPPPSGLIVAPSSWVTGRSLMTWEARWRGCSKEKSALETSRPKHKQKRGQMVRTVSLFPRFRTKGFNQNIAFQMCCSTNSSRSEQGGEACRRQNCGDGFSQSATRFTPTDWPELNFLRPEKNRIRGSHLIL